jgi:pimeloyl-ACP methyl ester carboxylesterase
MKVIYLHGFASGPGSKKARYFREKLEEKGVEMSIPDLASGDFEHLTITGQLQVIAREAAGGPVCLIGSSLGGYLAALFAAIHPDGVRQVALLAPAFSFASIFAASIGPEGVDEWRRTGKLSIFHYGAGAMRSLGYQLAEDSAQYVDFPDFKQPALIYHGSRDASVPVSLSERFSAGRPNVTLRVVDSDHELIDVLEPVCAGVIEFLKL